MIYQWGGFMNENAKKLNDTVITNDYCVGCGICASTIETSFNMKYSENGKYIPVINENSKNLSDVNLLSICPFSNESKNEDELGEKLYSNVESIKHNSYTGYYLKNYAGYVKEGEYREKGSSGGMGTWIASKLLKHGLVDAIIHVKSNSNPQKNTDVMFSYQISRSEIELFEGSKSKYYPIEMSEVIKYVRENPDRYALVGIPCFIKGIRLLAEFDSVIQKRIIYTIGLVCGHLKTDMFVKSMAWEMGIHPNNLLKFDFRVKADNSTNSFYGVEATGLIRDKIVTRQSPANKLYVSNWGHGFFKFKSCDFCDDVLAETADITIGDAWLPEYTNDKNGTNIIVVRNPTFLKIIEDDIQELFLDELSMEKIFDSQAGGFRHRREGMSYRLHLKDISNEWRPQKRFNASSSISNDRKMIYEQRVTLYEESYKAFKKAVKMNSFDEFIKHMDPYVKKYNNITKIPLGVRILNKIKRTLFRG